MWINLTSDDLKPYLAAAQLSALQTKALGSGQADPTATLISDIAGRIRLCIGSAGFAVSATPDAIPASLRGTAALLVLELLQSRLPGLSLSAEQLRAANEARATLSAIAARTLRVEAPDNPMSYGSPASRLVAVGPKRQTVTPDQIRRLG